MSKFLTLKDYLSRSDLEASDMDGVVEHFSKSGPASELVLASKERRNSGIPMPLILRSKLRGLSVDDVVSFCECEVSLIKID